MNTWKRAQQLEEALANLIQEMGLDQNDIAKTYWDKFFPTNDAARERVEQIRDDLTRALQARTGCDKATARRHVSAWLRRLYVRGGRQ